MKKVLALLSALLVTGQLAGCALWPSAGVKGEFSGTLGVNLTDGRIVREEDSHGGLHGDGDTVLVLAFTGSGERTAGGGDGQGCQGGRACP